MNFAFPWLLILIPFVPLIVFKRKKFLRLSFSNTGVFESVSQKNTSRSKFLIPQILRCLTFFCLIIALSRPRLVKENVWEESNAVDILLLVDVSTSMKAEDFTVNQRKYNRLEVVKNVISDFIERRQEDRIGLVMFAGVPMTVCPLTTDYSVLNEFLKYVQMDILVDGTAIGDALAFSVNRLKKSKAKSKIIILLTDGANTAGKIKPTLGAELAKKFQIKVYTIGAGKNGPVPYPVMHPFYGKQYQFVEIEIDEETLKTIASETGGRFFRATDYEELKNIYKDIDQLEKTKIKTSKTVQYEDIFAIFIYPGLLFLILELILKSTLFLRIP